MPDPRLFDDLGAAVHCTRTAASAIDWSPLRIEGSPHTLIGWTPELPAKVLATIGPEEPSGEAARTGVGEALRV
jgi:hypothetical protein